MSVARAKPESGSLGFLRAAGLIAAVAGAGASVGLTLYAGRHSASRILTVLFVFWVLSPFVALVAASLVSKSWPFLIRVSLYGAMLLLTLGSVASYTNAVLQPPRMSPAFMFVAFPLGSWLLILIMGTIVALLSRRGAEK